MMKMMTVAAAALLSVSVTSAVPPPKVRLPDEAAGIDQIVAALISVYDQFDVVALGESHEQKVESDLRVALVRHPDFAKKVRTIVVEFATTTEQTTLDRYIRGENVSRAQLERVRPGQLGSLTSDDPIYMDFFAAVRDVNSRLPADARIRGFGGEDNRNRDTAAVSILKEHVLEKQGKALVIYGWAHFSRAAGLGGIVARLDANYPGRTFTVMPVRGQRNYQKFDRALKTQARPVMVPLQRLPFRDFTAEEFVGGELVTCLDARCKNVRSVFKGSTLTLGQMADAAFYYVGGR